MRKKSTKTSAVCDLNYYAFLPWNKNNIPFVYVFSSWADVHHNYRQSKMELGKKYVAFATFV